MSNQGFTLLEVIIAVFILTVGVVGAFLLVERTAIFTQLTFSQLQAAYLAQEGMEIVRNIRDSNFLKIAKGINIAWDKGLTGCHLGCEADYNARALVPYASRYLKINGGFYNYDFGTQTKFKRKITIQRIGPDILRVEAEVSWLERGVPYSLKNQGNLYKWY